MKPGLKTAISNALCRVREEQGINNKELFEALFQTIPDFMDRVPGDARTKKYKEYQQLRTKMAEVVSELEQYLN